MIGGTFVILGINCAHLSGAIVALFPWCGRFISD